MFFDLDGTLLDTAPDLARALNTVLEQDGRPALPLDQVRGYVSHGVPGLLAVGYGIDREHALFPGLRERVLAAYERHLHVDTRLFEGMAEVLDRLDAGGLRWGIVTNKIARFTEPIVTALQLRHRACCIVSGDSAPRSKPWPDPLLLAAARTCVDASACVYVGDAERDMQAGRAAGMRTLAALFGYLRPEDEPARWPADGFLKAPQDLLDWLGIATKPGQ